VDQQTGDAWFSLKLGNPVEPRGEQPMAPVTPHSKAKANAYQTLGRDLQDDDIPF
jgi:hypothetical protein